MRKTIFILILSTIIILFFQACETPVDDTNKFDFQKGEGFFIINEGAFGQANASISYYNLKNDSIINNVFEQANEERIGDVLQNMVIKDDKAYLIVNNSSLIRVVDINSFEETASIEGFTSPRSMIITEEGKGFVSDLYAANIWVVDLEQNTIIDSIQTQGWTEEMVLVNDQIFVTGPTLYGEPISKNLYVIDAVSNTLVQSIELKANPYNIVYDGNREKIYVFCQGDPYGDPIISPSVYTIDPYDLENKSFFNMFGLPPAFTSRMVLDDVESTLYILYGNVYFADAGDQGLAYANVPLIESSGRSLYGLQTDPVNGNIFVTDAKDYNQLGELYEYKSNGILQNQLQTGVVPASVIMY